MQRRIAGLLAAQLVLALGICSTPAVGQTRPTQTKASPSGKAPLKQKQPAAATVGSETEVPPTAGTVSGGTVSSGAGPKGSAQPRSAPRGEAPAATTPRPPATTTPRTVDARATGIRPKDPAGPADPRGSDPRNPAGAQQPTSGANAPPAPPFTLTQSQQQLLDQILLKWEQQSDRVKTFYCEFSRWEYDETWGPKELNFQKTIGRGQINFAAPDRGEYKIVELKEWNQQKKTLSPVTDELDHWVCDGSAIYEFNVKKKQLIQRNLPPEMQGKAISDGPLPFVFGAKADQLSRRYWMRDVTPKEDIGQKIWLEAVPKYQADALNFQRATIVLNEADFMPVALQVYLPDGKANAAYAFIGGRKNDLREKVWYTIAPKLSPTQRLSGWVHVVEGDTPPAEQKPSAPPAGAPAQAKRPSSATKRK